jgi:hypothetical protein
VIKRLVLKNNANFLSRKLAKIAENKQNFVLINILNNFFEMLSMFTPNFSIFNYMGLNRLNEFPNNRHFLKVRKIALAPGFG